MKHSTLTYTDFDKIFRLGRGGRTAIKSWALYGKSIFHRGKGLKIFYVYSTQSKCVDVGIKALMWREINICEVQTCCKFSALFQKLGNCTRRYQWIFKVRNLWDWIVFEIYIHIHAHIYFFYPSAKQTYSNTASVVMSLSDTRFWLPISH